MYVHALKRRAGARRLRSTLAAVLFTHAAVTAASNCGLIIPNAHRSFSLRFVHAIMLVCVRLVLQDLKEVFSHDVLESLGASGGSKSLIRAEAMKAARCDAAACMRVWLFSL